MEEKPKLFREQYNECKDLGFIKTGRSISFDEHPELLPFCPEKRKRFLESGVRTITLMACLRFGGDCHSGKPECQKLRGFKTITPSTWPPITLK